MSLASLETHLVLLGLRSGTVNAHLQHTRQVLNSCTPLTQESFEQFIVSKRREGMKASSLNRLIISIRHYCACFNLAWGKRFPLLKEEVPNKSLFSDEEIEFIISLKPPPRFRPNIWARWTMWLQVMAYSGMRASECSTLTVNQIDWGSNNFILPNTKTTPRRVPISAILREPLKEYMKGVEYYLFPCPSKRGHVWRPGWQKHMNDRLEIAGIKRDGLTAHSFRHSFITNLWEESVPLPDIMNIVGHTSAETTIRYSHLGNKSAQKSINKHSLVKKHQSPIEQLESLVEEARKAGLLNSEHFSWKIDKKSLVIEITDKE